MSDKELAMPFLSLCIPTNGVTEWVFPVLDSIYVQNVDTSLFEVVVTDNGENADFKERMRKYAEEHTNLIYAETHALPFLNEIAAYKKATGQMIKFVNHRTKLCAGCLQKLIDFARENCQQKPITYFSNGELKLDKKANYFDSFDAFVRALSYWSSWSTGMTIWKSDLDQLPDDLSEYNELFPHMNVLFGNRDRASYVIDNSLIFDTIPQGNRPKGNYDLFFAFGVEYPSLILELYRSKSISLETYRSVLDDNLDNVSRLIWYYCIQKQYCSYDLSGLHNMIGIFYSKNDIVKKFIRLGLRRLFH